MPELPEVETIVRGLKKYLPGKTVEHTYVYDHRPIRPFNSSQFIKFMAGESFLDVKRQGKYLFFYLKSGKTIAAHLRMTGKYIFLSTDDHHRHSHIRLKFAFSDGSYLFYKDVRIFGTLRCYEAGATPDELKHMSPDLLTAGFNAKWLLGKAAKRSAPLKNFLLDQKVASGMGNIYASEALFRTKLNPFMAAKNLKKPDAEKLIEEIKALLKLAISKNGTSISDFRNVEDEQGDFQLLLKVYQKNGEKCSVCRKGVIQREVVAQRSTFFCPVCQKVRL